MKHGAFISMEAVNLKHDNDIPFIKRLSLKLTGNLQKQDQKSFRSDFVQMINLLVSGVNAFWCTLHLNDEDLLEWKAIFWGTLNATHTAHTQTHTQQWASLHSWQKLIRAISYFKVLVCGLFYYYFFKISNLFQKASCKLPVDTAFGERTIFGLTLQFVVIVGKQTQGEMSPMCRITVNDSAFLGYVNLRESQAWATYLFN